MSTSGHVRFRHSRQWRSGWGTRRSASYHWFWTLGDQIPARAGAAGWCRWNGAMIRRVPGESVGLATHRVIQPGPSSGCRTGRGRLVCGVTEVPDSWTELSSWAVTSSVRTSAISVVNEVLALLRARPTRSSAQKAGAHCECQSARIWRAVGASRPQRNRWCGTGSPLK